MSFDIQSIMAVQSDLYSSEKTGRTINIINLEIEQVHWHFINNAHFETSPVQNVLVSIHKMCYNFRNNDIEKI